jgi:hypothetical protein
MSYVEQWNAIAARIRSLRDLGDLYAQFLIADQGRDSFSVNKEIVAQSQSVLEEIRHFRQLFHAIVPPAPKACLDRFLDGRSVRIIISAESGERRAGSGVKFGPILLTAFESEMSFL